MPNLTALTCHYEPGWRPLSLLHYLKWFLNPRLVKFSAIPNISSTRSSRSKSEDTFIPSLFELLPQGCPNLEEIELIYYQPSWCANGTSSLYRHWPLLPQLRRVCGNGSLLEPSNLELLGQLAHLDSLIVKVQSRERLISEVSWPTNYFPSLRSMHLHNVQQETIDTLWGFSSLVSRLTEVRIQIKCDDFPGSQEGAQLQTFICNLPNRSPHIKNFSCTYYDGCSGLWQISTTVMNSLRQLPLENVRFKHMSLARGVGHRDLALALPHVRILRLESDTVPIEELCYYAALLSRLKVLSCTLSYLNVGAGDFANADASQTLNPVTHQVTMENCSIIPGPLKHEFVAASCAR